MATSSNASVNMGAECRRVRVAVVGGDLAILPANTCVIRIRTAIVAGRVSAVLDGVSMHMFRPAG